MRRAPVKVAATSLAAGLLAALIPAGQASAAGPRHRVLLRNGQYGYTTRLPPSPALAPERPSGRSMHSYGTINGTVRTRAGKGVSGECVTAVPAKPQFDLLYNYEPIPDVSAITTATGSYTLIALPGQYKIRFSTGCGAPNSPTRNHHWHQRHPPPLTNPTQRSGPAGRRAGGPEAYSKIT
jgi:hypothetical protein